MGDLKNKQAVKELGVSKKQLVKELNISWKDASELLEKAQDELGTHVAHSKEAVLAHAHELHNRKNLPESALFVGSSTNQGPKLCEGQSCNIL